VRDDSAAKHRILILLAVNENIFMMARIGPTLDFRIEASTVLVH
jgi:hypothetical protein